MIKTKKVLFFSLAGVALFLVLFFILVGAGFYPVARVNGSLVWAGDYYGRLSGVQYYKNAVLVQDLSEEDKRASLLSLIYDKIIFLELEKKGAGAGEAERRVEDVLSRDGGDLEDASLRLYGWSIGEFRKFSLIPQSREDILAETLSGEGVDFGEWISGELAKADVRIYFLPYRWEEGRVVEK